MSGLGQEDKWVLKEWTLGERFGANVVWFRRQGGLTQQELADRVGMKRTVLSKIERGRQLPRLDTILKLVAGLEVKNCDLVAWMWWDPAGHHHYETPPSIANITGYEVWDFDLPARFRVSPVGYETEERFKDRLRQRCEEDRPVLELLRDDAPKVAPRERPTAAWVLRTGEALRALREERGLSHDQLAERSPTTATFIRESRKAGSAIRVYGFWRRSAAPWTGRDLTFPLGSSRCGLPKRQPFKRCWTSWPSTMPVSPSGKDDGADPTSTEPESDAGGAVRAQPLAQPAAGRPLSARPRQPRRADPAGHRSARARSPPSSHRHHRQAGRRHERLDLRPAGRDGLAPRPLRRWRLLCRAPRGQPSPERPQLTADLQLQLDVLAEVLREGSDALTLQVLASRVLASPRSLAGGIALARALRDLDNEGLVISDGLLVRASRPALHFGHLLGSLANEVERSAF